MNANPCYTGFSMNEFSVIHMCRSFCSSLFLSASLDAVAPTVGFSSVQFKFEKHDITLFDLGGGKNIRNIWKNYFSEVYGVIYVVDSSEQERLEESKEVLRNLLEHTKVAGKPVLM